MIRFSLTDVSWISWRVSIWMTEWDNKYCCLCCLSTWKLRQNVGNAKKQRGRRKLCVYVGSFIPFVAMVTLTYIDSSSLSVTLDRCLPVAADVERRDRGFYGRWVQMRSGLKQTCTFLKQFQCCQNQQDLTFVFKDEQLNKVTGNFF